MQLPDNPKADAHPLEHPKGVREYVAVLYWSQAASWTSAPERAEVCLTLQMDARFERADAASGAFPSAILGVSACSWPLRSVS